MTVASSSAVTTCFFSGTTSTVSAGGGGVTTSMYAAGGGGSGRVMGSVSTSTWPLYNDAIKIRLGDAYKIDLPDGTVIEVSKDGSFVINDVNAKVVYRANRTRDFNAFINASDKIEDFIRFCGTHGVRSSEMTRLPISLFIAWLIIESARADGEDEPNVPLIPSLQLYVAPRCLGCGRYMPRISANRQINFCKSACLDRYRARIDHIA
jgi:hypothetical protein